MVLHSSCLGVGCVQSSQLFLELAELILQMKQQAMVERLELAVDRSQHWTVVTAPATS